MVKEVVKDVLFLGQKSELATKSDLQVGKDLQDTLNANREHCVGMAANLSLDGIRPTTRYKHIEVEYFDFAWKKQRKKGGEFKYICCLFLVNPYGNNVNNF